MTGVTVTTSSSIVAESIASAAADNKVVIAGSEADAGSSSSGSCVGQMEVKQDPGVNAGDNSNWNPANTRVFDVYMDNGASQTSQLLDIFSCDDKNVKPETGKRTAEEVELQNSGLGRRPQAFSGDFLEKLRNKRMKLDSKDFGSSLTLPMVKKEQSPTAVSNGTLASEHIALGQTDKWPSQMESAFIAALRLIIKNGTSKFKIFDKNYGRNELISLFVQYHTSEIRTKKQISSHIQVWKKSISNKIASNFKINDLDREILRLIEEGAPQTNESVKLFYSTFEEIISALVKNEKAELNSSPSDTTQRHPYLTPASSSSVNTLYASSNAFTAQPPPPDSLQRSSTPATPLEYAKSIYGNLKTYKCVPVKVQEQMTMQPGIKTPLQPVYGNYSQKDLNNPVLQSAKDLELQQRQLIENLSYTQNQLKLPPVSPDLYMRNMQPTVHPPQPSLYRPSSRGLASAPLSHYPMAYHQYQQTMEHVPAGMVLSPHTYHQQPQVYVPVSVGHGRSNNCGNFQFARLPMNDLQQPRMQASSPSSSSSSASPNDDHIHRERGTNQVNQAKR
ncbi:hypothetical protein HG536_0D04160 [Torulaspora globosa]|uniref:TEA domain-containing protein n=1 Tax=Torulaspora globosa TaxID=48254 RepID=A0A7G3ZHA8_9SACH|nr:uncharacterized protein HG536_0D04160 [Torulaspora globosa]QLL32894.1 hypothetical protein HG536_0D04160 [Torulaspora globosa]